jgi:tryptophan synthase beta chain
MSTHPLRLLKHDMAAYTDYFAGKLVDQDYDPKALEASLAHLPKVAAE